MKFTKFIVSTMLSVLLFACGGGGDDLPDSPVNNNGHYVLQLHGLDANNQLKNFKAYPNTPVDIYVLETSVIPSMFGILRSNGIFSVILIEENQGYSSSVTDTNSSIVAAKNEYDNKIAGLTIQGKKVGISTVTYTIKFDNKEYIYIIKVHVVPFTY